MFACTEQVVESYEDRFFTDLNDTEHIDDVAIESNATKGSSGKFI